MLVTKLNNIKSKHLNTGIFGLYGEFIELRHSRFLSSKGVSTMRLKIVLGCDCGTVLPYNYNHHLVKIINRAVHDAKPLASNRRTCNFFTFSQLYFDQYSIAKEGIQNKGATVHWYISSPKIYFLEGLLKGLKKAGCISIKSIQMPIQDIEIMGDPDIDERMEFSCMSPISIARQLDGEESRPRYGRIEDHDFEEKLRQELINKYYRVYDSLPSNEDLTIEFNQQYINTKERVSRLIDFNGVRILGYMVPFTVVGNPELIRLGYQCGFGHRNYYGFGMVKVWYPNSCGDSEDVFEPDDVVAVG